jgi:gluconolactonase
MSDFDIRSESFRSILRPDSQVVKLATGFQFTEGPVWVADGDCLLFSDIPANRVYRWQEGQGVSVWREPTGNTNGNTLDRQGRLISCEHSGRRVTRTERDGSITVLADSYGGKRLNSPNDVVVQSDGVIWFTDPPYGIKPEQMEQPAKYVFRLDPDGKLTVVADDFDMPNGLCFSPDEKLLYIADSSKRHHVRVFTVKADHTLADGRLFATIDPGVPDGMRMDTAGWLYSTAHDGVHVYAPGGELLGKILVPEAPANCTFGGDKRTLYITARTSLYAINLASAGAQAP